MTRWVRVIRGAAVVLGALCSLAAVVALVFAVTAPTTAETWGWAIFSYVYVACAAFMFWGAGNLE